MDMGDQDLAKYGLVKPLVDAAQPEKLCGNLNLDLGMIASNANRTGVVNSHRMRKEGTIKGLIGANLSGSSDDGVDEDDSEGGKPRSDRKFKRAFASMFNMNALQNSPSKKGTPKLTHNTQRIDIA